MRAVVVVLLGVVLIGLCPVGEAQTVKTFVFETMVDATSVGGSPETPIQVIYTFATDLAKGSGPFGETPASSSYGPIEINLRVGSESVFGSGQGSGITVFNDAGTTFVEDSYDVRGDMSSFAGQRLFGQSIELARFLLVDSDRIMFNNTDLPLTPDFSAEAELEFVDIFLRDDTGATFFVGGSGRPFTLTPLLPTCSSTVTTLTALNAEVDHLQTSANAKESLKEYLNNVQVALEAGLPDEARLEMARFIRKVIHRSTLEETRPGRIVLDEANHLVCSASNVVLNLPPD